MSRGRNVLRVFGLTGTLALGVTLTQAAMAAVAPPLEGPHPAAGATRIEASEAPTIDGDISDLIWAKAQVIDEFWQAIPNTGEPGTERTEVRVLYDADNLYFAIYAYDKTPERILVRAMSRDGQIGTGDVVRIIIDPGLTRRNAYTFQIGPSGGRVDAILQNNTTNLQEWDTIWTTRTSITDQGWIVEVAIPFRSISYEAGRSDWGMELTRQIRHKGETVRWSNYSATINFTDVSGAGTLTGITDVNQGLGLDLQVYGLARVKRDWHIPGEDTGISGTAGGNAFYKITPALTGTLTYNPDFSDAPLDVRQVNTTRFSLFTPETRDFFLQDTQLFEFGGRNFIGENNARTFFSRNIGLARGIPVSLVAGGKLSGEFGGFGVGALSVLTDKTPTSDGQVLSVARVTRPILAESKLGFIVTHGDPTGLSRNTVLGGDFQFRDSNFLVGGNVLASDIYYERSFSDAVGDDGSFGLGINLPNEPWGGRIVAKEVGTDFRPALGFANRTGIRDYRAVVERTSRYRNAALRSFTLTNDNSLITDLADNIESREHRFQAGIQTQATDNFFVYAANFFEAVPAPFLLPGNVTVPGGRYDWTNVGARIQTSQARVLQFELEGSCCSFYDGTGVEAQVELNFRPNEYFELQPGWEGRFIDLPTGAVDIHVLSADVIVNFTPDMQLAMQMQYDNISESFGLLARYRWEFTPGSELFVSFGQAATVPDTNFIAQRSQFLVRVGHTFRL